MSTKIKKPKKPFFDKDEIELSVTATELYIIELLEAIADKLNIELEEPD